MQRTFESWLSFRAGNSNKELPRSPTPAFIGSLTTISLHITARVCHVLYNVKSSWFGRWRWNEQIFSVISLQSQARLSFSVTNRRLPKPCGICTFSKARKMAFMIRREFLPHLVLQNSWKSYLWLTFYSSQVRLILIEKSIKAILRL